MTTSGAQQQNSIDDYVKIYDTYSKDEVDFFLSILRAEDKQQKLNALPDDQRLAVLEYEKLVYNINALVRQRLQMAHFARAPSEPQLKPALTFQAPQVVIVNIDSDSQEQDLPRNKLIRRNTQ